MSKTKQEVIEMIHEGIDWLQELYGDIEGIEVYLNRIPSADGVGTTTELKTFNILYNKRENILDHEE